MAGIFSVDDIRRSWGGDWANASDTDVINAYSQQAGMDPADVAVKLGFDPGSGGMSAKRLSSAVDSYQGNWYGLGEAAAGAMGLPGVEKWMRSGREQNELQSAVAARRAQMMGAVDSYKDVNSLGDAANYVAGLGIQSLPYAAEALVGGIGARAFSGGLRAAAEAGRLAGATPEAVRAAQAAERALGVRSTIGGVASSYPSSVADILSNQREQSNGATDIGSAAALGVPYAALNALGETGMLSRGKFIRSGAEALNRDGLKYGLARMGTSAARGALEEGVGEVGQEFMNQFGRMAVDPSAELFDPKAQERYLESLVGGAALGGAFGGGMGGWRKKQLSNNHPVHLVGEQPQQDAPVLGLPYNPSAGAYAVFPDGSVAINSEQEFQHRYASQPTNPNAPMDFVPSPYVTDAVSPYAYEGAMPFENTPLPQGPQAAAFEMAPFSPQGELFDSVGGAYTDGTAPQVEEQAQQFVDDRTQPLFHDPRKVETTAALRTANGGRWSKPVGVIADLISSKNWGKLDAYLQTADIKPAVLDVAQEIARSYQQQDINTMAQEGARRAQPGEVVGVAPVSNATEQMMRERNAQALAGEQAAAGQQQLSGVIADTDARVQGGQEQRTAQARMEVVDQALQGAADVKNGRNRAIKALRKAGFRDTMLTEQERAHIQRHFDLAATMPDENAPLPSTPNEMGDVVPERNAPAVEKSGKPKRANENKAFQLTPPPSTDADLAAIEKAQAKRERKDAQAPVAEPVDTRVGKQGELFRKDGKPTAKADQERPAPKTREPKQSKQERISKLEAFIACMRR